MKTASRTSHHILVVRRVRPSRGGDAYTKIYLVCHYFPESASTCLYSPIVSCIYLSLRILFYDTPAASIFSMTYLCNLPSRSSSLSRQAFRYLVRRHGCDLSYTQMIHSGKFAPDNARECTRNSSSTVMSPLCTTYKVSRVALGLYQPTELKLA